MILGIGVGWMEDEYRYLRTDFSQRGRMMDEWIDVMRVLWSEEQPAFQGEWISFEESAFEPKPVQEGGPPLTIGGLSDAAIRRAATKGHGWQPIQIGPEQVAAGVAKLRAWTEGEPRTVIFHARAELGDQADPEVSLIRGSMYSINDLIGRYAEAGVEHMLFDFNTTPTAGAIQDQMERIASEVFRYTRQRKSQDRALQGARRSGYKVSVFSISAQPPLSFDASAASRSGGVGRRRGHRRQAARYQALL